MRTDCSLLLLVFVCQVYIDIKLLRVNKPLRSFLLFMLYYGEQQSTVGAKEIE